MKKLTAVLLAALALACLAPQAGAATIGLKGGLNFANMAIKTTETATDIPTFKTQQGLTGGIFVSFNFGALAIQPEVLYSRRGLSYPEYADETVDVTGRFLVDYVEMPVLIKYSILSGPIKPFLYAGPSIGYVLKAQQGYDVNYLTGEEPDYTYRYETQEYFKDTEFAAVFGAGFDIKLPKVILSIEGRYHLGLTNVYQPTGVEDDIVSLKHKGISVLVGLGF